jgi:flagellar biogenesis protein FliO
VPEAVPAPNDRIELEDYQDPAKEQKKTSWFMGIIDSIFSFIKYVLYLAIVIAVGLLAIYGVKIFTTKYNSLTGGGHEILNVLEVRYMAPGKALCLVEVAGKVIVLGLAGNNINHLSDISDPEQVEMIKRAAAAKPEPLQPFQGYLEKVVDRFMYAPGKSSKAGKSAKASKPVKVKDLDAGGKSASSPRTKRPTETSNGAAWRDDLNSTGDNLRKLLEDIKEQDKKGKGQKPGPGRRGDDNR